MLGVSAVISSAVMLFFAVLSSVIMPTAAISVLVRTFISVLVQTIVPALGYTLALLFPSWNLLMSLDLSATPSPMVLYSSLVRKRDEIRAQSDTEESEEGNEQPHSTKKRKNDTAKRINEVLEDFAREEDADNAVLMELRDVEAKHHSELVTGLKTLAEELKEDRLARKEEADRERELRKQEWIDMMRLFARGFDRN